MPCTLTMMYPFIKVDSQLFNDTLALPRGCLCFATGIWTLGNVAGDSPPKRDACLQAGALLAILPILDRCRGMGDAEMQRWLGMGMLKGRETSQVSRLGCGNFQTYGKLVLPCESIHVFFIYASVRIIHRPVYWKLYLEVWTLFNWGRLLFDGLTAFKHAQGSPPCL